MLHERRVWHDKKVNCTFLSPVNTKHLGAKNSIAGRFQMQLLLDALSGVILINIFQPLPKLKKFYVQISKALPLRTALFLW